MTRWTKDKIYRRELEKALNYADYPEAEQIAAERTEEIFADLSDTLYEEKRDREFDRD